MRKIIKIGENIGVAKQVQGHIVEVVPHPKFKGMWQFQIGDEKWIASDYAFKETELVDKAEQMMV